MIAATIVRQNTIRDRAERLARRDRPPRQPATEDRRGHVRLSTAATTRPASARIPTIESRTSAAPGVAAAPVSSTVRSRLATPTAQRGERRTDRPSRARSSRCRTRPGACRRRTARAGRTRRRESRRRRAGWPGSIGRSALGRRSTVTRHPRHRAASRPRRGACPAGRPPRSRRTGRPRRAPRPDRDAAGQDRREGRGPGRLEDLLEPLEREAHPGQDRRVVEQDDVRRGGGCAIASVQHPGERGAQAVGHARRAGCVTTSPRSPSTSDIAFEPLRLHAVDRAPGRRP